jgi:large subunit ribosomal protein L25
MAKDFDLIAEIREDQGKGASRRLRHEGKVPAIIYGAGRPPRSLTFYSSILNIQVNEKSQAAIVKDIQRHPSKPQIMHMDFQRIVEDEKIRMNVPIHYLNAEEAVGVKQEGGSVSQLITDIEITCLPKDLPEYFEVDIENLGLNEMLYISDIPLPEGVEIPILAQGPEENRPIVSIAFIKEVVIEEEVEEIEVPVEGEEVEGEEAAPEEGGEAAEGGEEKPEE